MNTNNSKIYFKGLNGLRAIAALLVLFGHTNEIVFPKGIVYNPVWSFLTGNGSNAVNCFFVLSGFLISYLLLIEISNTGTVSVKNFYFKRILRIWPIYYLVIFSVQFIFPAIMNSMGLEWKTVSKTSFLYYIAILPNISYLFFDTGKLFHLWSIGVEEQFYLVWAPLVKWFKNNIVLLCISVIFFKLIILVILKANSHNFEIINNIYLFVKQFKIEQMCIGGLGAYFAFKNTKEICTFVLFKWYSQVLIYLILIFFLTTNLEILENSYLREIYILLFNKLGFFIIPFLFLYVILNLSLNKKSLLNLENKVFKFLGEISYGFYVYHFLSVIVTIFILSKLNLIVGTIPYALLFYLVAISLNVLVSWLSNKYFEKPIIKYGRRVLKID